MAKTSRQLEAEIQRAIPREGSGQYAVRNFDRMCICDHVLGEHTAARVAGQQECLIEGCPCMTFTRQRARP
jgi:hypothetical protein